MKLLSFIHQGRPGYGAVVGDGVLDLSRRLGDRYPTLRHALDPDGLAAISAALSGAVADLRLDQLELQPAVPDAGKIICVGRNYGKHAAEGGRQVTEKPMLFPRYPSAHVGHGQALVRPFVSEQFDYEGELAVVIGRAGRHIPAARYAEHVAGYACFNDGSLRDWQFHTQQFMAGKTFWRSGSFGPWVVTADEIADPGRLRLVTRLNGTVVQDASTADMIFNVPTLIEYISTVIDLQPGDVIATGTPEGVGLFRKPPLFMKQGDVVEVEIEGIGTLRNSVIDEAPAR